MPSSGDAGGEDAGARLVGFDRQRLFGERDRAEPPLPSGAQPCACRIEGHVVARDDAVGEPRLDVGKRDRRRRDDAAGCRAAGHFGDREIRLARERRGGIDRGAAAVDQ